MSLSPCISVIRMEFHIVLLVLAAVAANALSARLPDRTSESDIEVQDTDVNTTVSVPDPGLYLLSGEEAPEGRWPWMAAVYKNGAQFCGASLIGSRWLLSIADCHLTKSDSLYLGSTDLSLPGPKYYIEKAIFHPQRGQGNGLYHHDIVLLKLASDVKFDEKYVRPITLPTKEEDFTDMRTCWMMGWNRKASNSYDKNKLYQSAVSIYDSGDCDLPSGKQVQNYEYCAGRKGAAVPCWGDRGGPLVCEEYGIWKLAGVVSWYDCQRPNALFSKVSYYLDWIRQETGL